MPIPSKFSVGNAALVIVPINLSSYNFTPSSLLTLSMITDPELTSDQVAATGYDYGNDFKNDDLEAVLVERGFSQTRLDVLASLEYKAPIESILDANETGIAETTYSSAAAELMDMQGQLKQLRYAEALEFLSQEMGLHAVDGKLEFEATESSESLLVDSEALIDQYDAYMEEAQTVLEWLSKLYRLITEIFYSMQVRTNSYIDGSSSTIDSIYDAFDDDIVTNKTKGKLNLLEYLTDVLSFRSGFILGSTDTTVIVQLLYDMINRILFPISGTAYNSASSTEGGKILGIESDASQSFISALKGWQFLPEFWTTSPGVTIIPGITTGEELGVGFTDSNWTSEDDFSSFTKGDYIALRDLIMDDEEGAQNAAYICRLVGSNYILINAFSAYTLEDIGFGDVFDPTTGNIFSMSSSVLAQMTVVNGRSSAASTNVPVINVFAALSSMLGIDPTISLTNINNISPTGAPGSLLLELLTPIAAGITEAGKIMTFNIGTNVPTGTYQQESGKRYFIGPLLGADLDTAIDRMNEFSQSLGTMSSQLLNIVNLLVCADVSVLTEPSSGMSFIGESPIGIEGRTSASSFLDAILEQLQQFGSDVAGHGTSLGWEEAVQLWCMLIGGQNENISYQMFKIAMLNAGDEFDVDSDIGEALAVQIDMTAQYIYDYCTDDDVSVGNHIDPGSPVDRTTVFAGSGWTADANDSDFRKLSIPENDSLTKAQIAEALSFKTSTSPLSLASNAVHDFQLNLVYAYGGSNMYELNDTVADYLPLTYYSRVGVAYVYMEAILQGSMHAMVCPTPEEEQPPRQATSNGWNDNTLGTTPSDKGAEVWYSRRAGAGLQDAIILLRSMRDGQVPDWDSMAQEEANGMKKYEGSLEYDWSGNQRYGEINQIRYTFETAQYAYTQVLEQDVNIINDLHYLTAIFKRLKDAMDALTSYLKDTDFESSDVNQVLGMIKSDPEFGRLALTSLTRDSLSLNYSIKDSLNQSNREYPYLPAAKASMINQMNDLATISLDGEFMTTYRSGRKRIMVVGIPSGAIERLRNAAVDATSDLQYWESTVIKLRLYRRNLLDDTEVMIPKEYMFDTSKFILEGRSSKPEASPGVTYVSSSENIDAAEMFLDGWDVEDLLDNTVVYSYGVDGIEGDAQGDAYGSWAKSHLRDGSYKTVFKNHVNDFYLKQYLMLTLGIDVNEDIFPFLEQEIFFDGPDEGLEKEFARLKQELGERFPTRDVVSSINYNRLVGELQRSIVFSGKKYRNRILYPKIFDRVFCIMIDESDWNDAQADSAYDMAIDPVTGLPDYDSMAFPEEQTALAADVIEPTYYQFFADMNIMLPATLEESTEEATVTVTSADDFLSGAEAKQSSIGNLTQKRSSTSEAQTADDILSEPQGGAEGKKSYLDL